ncbi:WbqC-like protein family protein [Zobellia uliginosa]|uniref:WbqC-like protein family protein n=1 Tax=Zobellia uliginosa TaxID=143224 RepID=A0ABY1KMF3_9FLAO|nr:WbqC family protein [Zobellia uliginosa]SIS49778.1 WbqC-like protein family protein [Zobellia uliginosa]
MKILLNPAYVPDIASFSVIAQHEVCWEVEDNFQKQTYRNRAYICNDLGRHMLSIPIRHLGGSQGRQKYKDVKLENTYQWQRQHWRTLQTAYRTSPFFEFYEDEIAPLYEKPYEYLLDFNLLSIQTVCDCLQLDMPEEKTVTFETKPESMFDGRFLVNAKNKLDFAPETYTQVFSDRNSFVANTSILDLLFNEGTNALSYLKAQDLSFLNA